MLQLFMDRIASTNVPCTTRPNTILLNSLTDFSLHMWMSSKTQVVITAPNSHWPKIRSVLFSHQWKQVSLPDNLLEVAIRSVLLLGIDLILKKSIIIKELLAFRCFCFDELVRFFIRVLSQILELLLCDDRFGLFVYCCIYERFSIN